jgi:hypothetical protein
MHKRRRPIPTIVVVLAAPTAADSLAEAAAELAIRIGNIESANSCDSGNPPVLRYLVPVVWRTTGQERNGRQRTPA